MQINQVGLAPGAAGFAREDGLSTGALVTVVSTAHEADFEVNLLWVGMHPQPDTTSVQTLQPYGADAFAFSPSPGVYGTWRIELITDRGTANEDRQVRTFAIKQSPTAVRIPAANESSDPEASLLARGQEYIDRTEHNAGDGVLGSPMRDASWVSHWRPLADLIYRAMAGLLGGGGGGGGTVNLSDTTPIDADAGTGSPGDSSSASRGNHRHRVAVGTPVSIGAANAVGTGNALALAQHVHAHDTQPGGTLHATALGGGSPAAGFMSGADKVSLDAAVTKLAGIAPGATVGPADPTVAPLALSDSTATLGATGKYATEQHVHPHGTRGGGTLHATALGGGSPAAGFISGADKVNLDAAVTKLGSLPNALTLDTATLPQDVSQVSVAGSGTNVAPLNHRHGHGTGHLGGNTHATALGGGSPAAGFMSGADKVQHDANTAALPNKVTGPASAVANQLPKFSDTTGKVLSASGVSIDVGNAMTGLTGLTVGGTITGNIVAALAMTLAGTDLATTLSAKAEKLFDITAWNTAGKTLALSDLNKLILCQYTAGSPVLTIPRDSTLNLPVGFTCQVLADVIGVGAEWNLSFVSEVMTGTFGTPGRYANPYSHPSNTPVQLYAQPYQLVTMVKIAADKWYVSGNYAPVS
jgi:hypothetical protein